MKEMNRNPQTDKPEEKVRPDEKEEREFQPDEKEEGKVRPDEKKEKVRADEKEGGKARPDEKEGGRDQQPGKEEKYQVQKKSVLRKAILVELIFTALFILLVFTLQSMLSLLTFVEDIKRSEKHIKANMEAAKKERDEAVEGVDQLYNAQVGIYSLLSAVNGGALYQLDRIKTFYGLNNYYILDRQGNVKKTSNLEKIDFHQGNLKYLYQMKEDDYDESADHYSNVVIRKGKDGKEYRCYSSLYNDYSERSGDIIVFEYDPVIIDDIINETISFESLLKNESVGFDGFAFALDGNTGALLYKPDSMAVDEIGFDKADLAYLKDGGILFPNIDNNTYVMRGIVFEEEDAVVCLTVPVREIIETLFVGNLGVIITFFNISSIMLVYSVLLEEDYFRKKSRSGWKQIRHSRYYYNPDIGHRIMLFSVLGMLFIGLATIYFQSLIVLSRRSQNTMAIASDTVSAINKKKNYTKTLKDAGEDIIFSSFVSVCNGIFAEDKIDDDLLKEVQTSSNIASIAVLDSNMKKVIASSNHYILHDIEDNKGTRLMQEVIRDLELEGWYIGEPFQVEDSQEYEMNLQYLGYKNLYDSKNKDAIILCLYKTDFVEAIRDKTVLRNVLSRIETGDGGRACSISKKDRTFTYFPKASLIGKKAGKYGVKKQNLVNGYNGTIQLNGKKYFAAVKETDENYIVITVPMNNIMSDRIPMCIAAVMSGFLVFLLIFLRMSVEKDVNIREYVYPGKKRSESAEDIIFKLIKRLFLGVALLVSLMNLFSDAFLKKDNLIRYVFYGNWTKGFNIFSFTACMVNMCQGVIIVSLMIWVLQSLEKLFSEKGATVCRLLASLLRYVGLVAISFFCIASFGVNPTTLAASLGILTTVIGLGANSLLQDIFAGLFIIFEGDLKVNEEVLLGDSKAKIVEIGIRATKFRDNYNNTRIINNKNIVDITTRSKGSHRLFYNLRMGKDIPGSQVMEVLDSALDHIRSRYPEYVMDVENRGIILGDEDYVQYRFVVRTRERLREKTDAMVRKEVASILKENAIPEVEWL